MTSDHYDALAVLLVGLGLLVAVEMRLRALFARHEVKEERFVASAILASEGAIARVSENVRQIDELRIETNAIRLDLTNLAELVRVHEARISDAEIRLLRSSMLVPRRGEP